MRFKVWLSHPSREPVIVNYQTTGGTATKGTDFESQGGFVEISANSWAAVGSSSPSSVGMPYYVGVRVHDDHE